MEYKKLIKEAVAAIPPSPVLFELISAYEKLAEAQEKRDNADYYIELYGDEAKKVLGMLKEKTISREQVERMRGEWVAKHRHRGGFRQVTGVDDMGEQRTITIDERCEYDDRYCSRCGKQSPDNFLNFCGYCGVAMTDEAMEMVMERLEALHETVE